MDPPEKEKEEPPTWVRYRLRIKIRLDQIRLGPIRKQSPIIQNKYMPTPLLTSHPLLCFAMGPNPPNSNPLSPNLNYLVA